MSRRRRRRFRRALRGLLVVCVALAVLSWAGAALAGHPTAPFMALGFLLTAAVTVPVLLLATIVAVVVTVGLTVATLAIPAAIFVAPFYVVYRLMRGPAPRHDAAGRESLDRHESPAQSEESLLRRRYVAGELTYQQFQSGMIGLLKERFARGELPMTAYEAELEKLLQPARLLDVAGDPALAAATATRR